MKIVIKKKLDVFEKNSERGNILQLIMFWFILVTVLALCVLLTKRQTRDVPPLVVGSWPIFGYTFKLLKNTKELHKLIIKVSMDCLRKGGVTTTWILGMNAYVITDPTDAYIVLNTCLKKDVLYDFFKPWIGEGLISSTESIWKIHRKLLNPTFNQIVLDSYLPVINVQARALVHSLEAKVGKGKFDATPFVEHMALQTICSTAMGVNNEDDAKLMEEYLIAKNKFEDGLVKRTCTFWLYSEFIYNLTSLKKTQDDLARTLHGLTNAIIRKRKSEMTKTDNTNDGKRFQPFLKLLLDMEKEGVLTEKEVQEEVDTFTFAGSETSAVALVIALLVIGSYPDVQRKIVDELREVFDDSERDLEKQDFSQLNYLEATIKETMRLYPTIPFIARNLERDVKISNFTLRSGSRCCVSLYGVNRHQSWGEDADSFRPERWLQPGAPVHNFAAFGMGKRRCIGGNYAIMALKAILVHLLRRYRVHGDITQLRQRIEVVARPLPMGYISIDRRAKIDYIGQKRSEGKFRTR